MEFKRVEGTTIHIPSGKKINFLQNKKMRELFCFLLSMVFLSVFIYLFPLGEIKSGLDEALHLFTCSIPMFCLLIVLRFDLINNNLEELKNEDNDN